MSRQITTTVHTFAELDDQAKEKARAWFRDGAMDYEWWDSVYDDTLQIAAILGITIASRRNGTGPAIYFSGFSSQGDGASFEGDYAYRAGAAKAIREYAPQDKTLHGIADALQKIQAPRFYGLTASVAQRGHYSHSGTMTVDVSHSSDYGTVTADDEDGIQQQMRELADWIYSSLESEYEYLNADEQVDEAITANEYEFDEDGHRV